ncbi:MAG: hypothetical protein ABSG91_08410 [Syntrophobacteraceae bacterium]|jgi:hypothetical protein
MNTKPKILQTIQTAAAVVTTGIFLTLPPSSVTREDLNQLAKKTLVIQAAEVTTIRNPIIQISTDTTFSARDFRVPIAAINRSDMAYEYFRDAWFNDPSLLISSFAEDFMESDDFRGLVQLGEGIYPYVLKDLDPETAIRWDLVLTQIHGQTVVPEREWGKPDKIASRWTKFLRQSI